MIVRKYTFRLYPNTTDVQLMLDTKRVHCELYNAALQERIEAYRKAGLSINFAQQCRSLTEIRGFEPRVSAVNCHSAQGTLRRLDRAFKAFFSRVKKGETPGFPRFKSFARFPGWSYNCHGDGFRFHSAGEKHGRLYLAGIGTIKARGKMRIQGKIKCCEILHRNDRWYVSLTVEAESADRVCLGGEAFGFDWGVETLLTGISSSGEIIEKENPRWYKTAEARQTELQQAVSRKKLRSKGWKRACKALRTFKSKQARKRHDHHHKLSAEIAENYAAVCGEALQVKNMTRSGKGTVEEPGKRVAQKSGLNREILDTAPGALYAMINCKVTETGSWFVKAPTKSLKPSQRCPVCWQTRRKTLNERVHLCEHCGHTGPRDQVSAHVNLIWLEQQLQAGNQPDRGNPVRNYDLFSIENRS